MEIQHKEPYETPAILIVEVKTEGIVCASGLNNPGDYPSGGDPFQF